MGAIVLVDPGAAPNAGGGRRYALPLLLVAGWAGLFAYSAAYLTEDMPFRPPPAEAGRSADAARPDAPPARVVVLDPPAAQALPPVPASEAPARDAPRPAVAAAIVPAAMPVPPLRTTGAAVPDYVGVWGPKAVACGALSRRRGYLPATITPDHARAGRTLCSFRDSHRTRNGWLMAAECSSRGRRWTSQVRLVVDGEHLTWSSSRGTETYVRCSRRAG